ncbi:MAG: hypoxanthine phosphoribosyltransferase [Chloroflexi bacterium]|nr:MAG: hypoxanthine phosphoribosyltransferase [Chloroflexota bacterium]
MSEKFPANHSELSADVRSIIFDEEAIEKRVGELAAEISRDYTGKNPLLVGVLKGVLFFMADLARKVTVPVELDFMAVSNFSPETRDQGVVRLVKDLEIPLNNRHVLFVEDVVDTGLTLSYLLRNLRSRQPTSLEVCTLFNKPEHRLIDLPIRYKGFDLPDQFVIGYGLDYREKYRNLPYVGLLKAEILKKGS